MQMRYVVVELQLGGESGIAYGADMNVGRVRVLRLVMDLETKNKNMHKKLKITILSILHYSWRELFAAPWPFDQLWITPGIIPEDSTSWDNGGPS